MFFRKKESNPESKEGTIKVIETKKGRRVTMVATGKKGFGAWKGYEICIAPKNY